MLKNLSGRSFPIFISVLSLPLATSAEELSARLNKLETSAAAAQANIKFGYLRTSFSAIYRDLPFVLVYLVEVESATARLVVRTGLASDCRLAPSTIALDGSAGTWPVGAVVATGALTPTRL